MYHLDTLKYSESLAYFLYTIIFPNVALCQYSVCCSYLDTPYYWDHIWLQPKERNNIFNTIYAIMQVHHTCPPNILSLSYNWQNVPLFRSSQDPRLQGRAPGFRQGQDRDEIGTWQGQVRQGQDKGRGRVRRCGGRVMGWEVGVERNSKGQVKLIR